MAHAKTNYRVVYTVPRHRLVAARLLYDQALDGCGGIDTKDLSRRYPAGLRKLPSEWLAMLEGQGGVGRGHLLIQTWRNLVQNPRCPAWSKRFGICQSSHEQAERSRRPYYGISFLREGGLRVDAIDFSRGLPDDVLSWGGGIPILLDGQVLTIERFITEVADFSHVWRLRASSSRPSPEWDLRRYERLQAVFLEVAHAPAAEAGEALIEEARGTCPGDPPLVREDSYLHNVAGVRPDGGLVVLVANGSLESLAEMARDAGAVSAVVIDDGGSCQVSLRRGCGSDLRPLVESYYHRPPTIALAVYELSGDDASYTFTGQPDVHPPLPGPHFLSDARRTSTIELQFDTDLGPVSRRLTFPRLDSAAIDVIAIDIANFAVIHGACSVHLAVSEELLCRVRSRFNERFRAARRSQDPTRLRGLWLEDYLTGIFDRPFEIDRTLPVPPSGSTALTSQVLKRESTATWSIGLDVGASAIKAVLVRDGHESVASMDVPTRGSDPATRYESHVLANQVSEAVRKVRDAAGVPLDEDISVGVSWPGAVRNGKAAPSKTLLDLTDVLSGSNLDRELFERIRDLRSWIRAVLKLSPGSTIEVYNDGEVEVAYEARVSGLHGALLCKIGTTVAGGYVDPAGTTSYLTELGRAIIRTDVEAPRHPSSCIQGVASRCIGSIALAQEARKRGLIGAENAIQAHETIGHRLCEIIDGGSEDRPAAEDIVREMGRHVAELLMECFRYLDGVNHVLLRGGLCGNHPVGAILRQCVRENLPEHVRRLIRDEDPPRHSGAYAAAVLAAGGY